MGKIPSHPKKVQQNLNKQFKNLFTKPALTILKKNGVTRDQYVAWASQDFMRHSFWAGILFALGFSGLMSWASFVGGQESGTGFLLVGLGLSLFFFLLFLLVAFSLRTSFPQSNYKGGGASSFYTLGLLRKAELKFMERLSPAKWDRIKKMDVERWEKRQKPYVFSKEKAVQVEKFKSAFKKLGFRFTFFFALMSGFILVAPHIFYEDGGLRMVTLYLFDLSYMGTVLGYSGWWFCYGLLGFIKRDIVGMGNFEEVRWSGLMATIIGLGDMILAIFIFALFMLLPIWFMIESLF